MNRLVNSLLTAAAAVFIFAGCSLTKEAKACSDYNVGGTYIAATNMFLFVYDKRDGGEIPKLAKLGYSATPKTYEQFLLHAASSPQVAGIVRTGDRMTVMSIKYRSPPLIGPATDVIVLIDSGVSAGKTANVCLVSRDGRPSACVNVDPKYLLLSENGE